MICDDCLLKDTCTASEEEREMTLFCMEKVKAEQEAHNDR